jgi:hemoglobin/transferrin/lactoferrin receptor protein
MINLFANYSAGFKAPAPSQVNNAFTNFLVNYTSIPNPDLKPETSNTVEGGVRFNGGRWQVGVTGFAGWYEDFIEQVQIGGSFTPTDPGIFQYINLGSVEISGVELKGEAQFESGFGLLAALSYTHGQAESDGVSAPLNSIEPLKLVGGVSYRDPMGRFGGQLVATYSGGKDEDRIDQSICTPTCFAPGSFVIMDATAYWNVFDAVTLRAGIFNIFDEKYWWWSDVRGVSSTAVSRDAYTSPGRNFRVSLTARI